MASSQRTPGGAQVNVQVHEALDKKLLDCRTNAGCVNDAINIAKEVGSSAYSGLLCTEKYAELAKTATSNLFSATDKQIEASKQTGNEKSPGLLGLEMLKTVAAPVFELSKNMISSSRKMTDKEILKLEANAHKLMALGAEIGFLVGKGASIDRACAIHYAVANCQDSIMTPRTQKSLESILKLLQHLGGDINRPDKDGDTPLHVAAALGSVPTVRCLLELGAGPSRNAVNVRGKNPFQACRAQTQRLSFLGFQPNQDEAGDIRALLKPTKKRRAGAHSGGDASKRKK